jgi:LysM repeat protein
VIQPGDTLSDIAVRFDVTEAVLVQTNRLGDPRRIVSGQTLIIPAAPVPTTTPSADGTAAVPPAGDAGTAPSETTTVVTEATTTTATG